MWRIAFSSSSSSEIASRSRSTTTAMSGIAPSDHSRGAATRQRWNSSSTNGARRVSAGSRNPGVGAPSISSSWSISRSIRSSSATTVSLMAPISSWPALW